MKLFEIYLPLYYNDQSPVEARKFQKLQGELLEQFEGFTYVPQPRQGVWKFGDMIYRDEIVIYRVLAYRARKARRFFEKMRAKLEKAFRQEKVLILEIPVRAV